jgi:GNAT superfamily N-acetyltransferase
MSEERVAMRNREKSGLIFAPLTKERWPDFEQLFGERGACGGCWCMWWKLKRSEFERQKGAANKKAMQTLVASGSIPGLLAYVGQEPVGWCAVAPREHYPTLERSRVLTRIDDRPVWSVTCFFIKRTSRNKGLSVQLLKAVIDYVKRQGGAVIEGYPVDPQKGPLAPTFAWTGLFSAFQQAGFVECVRHSPTRPIMRYFISKNERRRHRGSINTIATR